MQQKGEPSDSDAGLALTERMEEDCGGWASAITIELRKFYPGCWKPLKIPISKLMYNVRILGGEVFGRGDGVMRMEPSKMRLVP